LSVTGNVPCASVKPAPLTVAPLIVTAVVPVELRVIDCVVGVLTPALPKFTLDELTLSAGAGTFNWMAKVSVTPPTLAVRVAVCATDTGVAYAMNCTLVRFALTNPAGDTVTAALLLDKATRKPAAGAGPLMVAVQRSVAVPPIDGLVQEIPVSTGKPVPISATTAVLFVMELLVTLNCPASAPSTVGSNCTATVAVWPGLSVTGNVPCASVKPAPLTAAPLIVTAAVPVELRVIDWLVGVLTPALPKFTLGELTLSAGAGTFNWMAKVSLTPPALAVNVAVCAADTGVAYAVNCTLVRFSLINPAGDTVTAALLLDRATRRPAAGAGPLMVAVQRSVAVPPIDALVQDRLLNCGVVAELSAAAAGDATGLTVSAAFTVVPTQPVKKRHAEYISPANSRVGRSLSMPQASLLDETRRC
jgi:hypothetical protein